MTSFKLNMGQNAQISDSVFGKPQNWETSLTLAISNFQGLFANKISLDVKLIRSEQLVSEGIYHSKNQEKGSFGIHFQSKIEFSQKISCHPDKMEQERINFTANVFTF